VTAAERLYRPAGSLRRNDFALELAADGTSLTHTSLRILEIPAGAGREVRTGGEEMIVLPLSGSCSVEVEGDTFALAGRAGVFAGISDFAYLPIDATARISSERGGRFALAGARAQRRLPARYGAARDVPVELRGAGSCSRQVVNFCTPDAFEADRLIACEVLTPGGNWSSFPPHKHDEEREGETNLEEIYYFEVAEGRHGPGVAYQRVYGDRDRPVDVLAEVRTGDVVLVPHGWHGPSIAMPGYDLYYLNVMAGPGRQRAWRISFDPTYEWVNELLRGQPVDPRLPLVVAGS
jgi:5-deoxy-glucuronate isomerase